MDEKEIQQMQWMLDNYESLEKAGPLIDRHMKPWMKEQGFSRKGRNYFKIVDDIAYCVANGIGDLVHTHYYILPLYIPTDYIYLQYGDEIEHQYRQVLRLYRRTTQENVDSWYAGAKEVLENEIFPFFEQISSKKKLLNYISQGPSHMFISREGPWIERLRTYSYLCLLDREKATAALEEYKRELHITFSNSLDWYKAEKEAELLEISKLLQKTDEEITTYFQNVCKETMANCFQPKRR